MFEIGDGILVHLLEVEKHHVFLEDPVLNENKDEETFRVVEVPSEASSVDDVDGVHGRRQIE